MAHTLPTPDNLTARYPEFADVSDYRIEAAIDEAARFVDETWKEEDYYTGALNLAAHFLVREGALLTGSSQGNYLNRGPVTSESIGDASRSYATSGSGSGGSGSSGDLELSTTPYGKRYATLLKLNRGGPRIV